MSTDVTQTHCNYGIHMSRSTFLIELGANMDFLSAGVIAGLIGRQYSCTIPLVFNIVVEH